MNFIFLRHSIYDQPKLVPSALLPHPITTAGIDQAKSGAQKIIAYFKTAPELLPKQIETSSLLRAFQTAQIIADEINSAYDLDIELVENDNLVERKMGSMANLTVNEIENILSKDPRYTSPPKGWKSSREYKLPYIGCESLSDAGKRVAKVIQTPPNPTGIKHNSKYRIIVGHGASFRHACYELGILQESDIAKLSMYYAEPLFFTFDNNSWKHIAGNWKIRSTQDNID